MIIDNFRYVYEEFRGSSCRWFFRLFSFVYIQAFSSDCSYRFTQHCRVDLIPVPLRCPDQPCRAAAAAGATTGDPSSSRADLQDLQVPYRGTTGDRHQERRKVLNRILSRNHKRHRSARNLCHKALFDAWRREASTSSRRKGSSMRFRRLSTAPCVMPSCTPWALNLTQVAKSTETGSTNR